jgi:hypothetical protein
MSELDIYNKYAKEDYQIVAVKNLLAKNKRRQFQKSDPELPHGKFIHYNGNYQCSYCAKEPQVEHYCVGMDSESIRQWLDGDTCKYNHLDECILHEIHALYPRQSPHWTKCNCQGTCVLNNSTTLSSKTTSQCVQTEPIPPAVTIDALSNGQTLGCN